MPHPTPAKTFPYRWRHQLHRKLHQRRRNPTLRASTLTPHRLPEHLLPAKPPFTASDNRIFHNGWRTRNPPQGIHSSSPDAHSSPAEWFHPHDQGAPLTTALRTPSQPGATDSLSEARPHSTRGTHSAHRAAQRKLAPPTSHSPTREDATQLEWDPLQHTHPQPEKTQLNHPTCSTLA